MSGQFTTSSGLKNGDEMIVLFEWDAAVASQDLMASPGEAEAIRRPVAKGPRRSLGVFEHEITIGTGRSREVRTRPTGDRASSAVERAMQLASFLDPSWECEAFFALRDL